MRSSGPPRSRRSERGETVRPGLREFLAANRGTIASFLICGAYVLWTLFDHSSPMTKRIVGGVACVVVGTIGGGWGLWGLRACRRGGVGTRGALAATLLSVGTLAYGFGGGIYAYYEVVLKKAPFPSWADAAYMTSYATIIAGILLLPSKPLAGIVRIRVLLDSLMVLAALFTFSWYFALGPAVLDGTQSVLGRVLGAAYPVLDLVMIFCALVLASFSQEPAVRRARNLVCIGVVAFVVSDSSYLFQTLQGTYATGQPADAGWLLCNFLVGQAAHLLRRLPASSPSTTKAEEGRGTSLWRMLAPYALVPAVVALIVYVYNSKSASGSSASGLAIGVYVCAGTLVALIMVRQVFAIAENARLNRFLQEAYRELEALATTDSMTGLANHRVFQERLRQTVDESREGGTPMALLLVDVDRFKQYNDGFGHPAGDEALKIVARVLKENVRETDLAARYGGEEFAAILPNMSVVEAILVAERIREACEATAFPHRQVTLSIGVAVGGGEPSELIEQADLALYAAKHAGRNQVVCEGLSAEVNELLAQLAEAKRNALPQGWSVESNDPVVVAAGRPEVRALLGMLELRDPDVHRHSERVARLALRLAHEANALGIAENGAARIAPEAVETLAIGALLHDVGKMAVPDSILHKTGALTPAEWALIMRHPVDGAELVARFPELSSAVPLVRSHHERWDGEGYPERLRAEDIPLAARLFALANTMDAMACERPYRTAKSFEEIREEIVRMSGTQFDPSLVRAFLAVPESEWAAIRGDDEGLSRAA